MRADAMARADASAVALPDTSENRRADQTQLVRGRRKGGMEKFTGGGRWKQCSGADWRGALERSNPKRASGCR